VTWTARQSCNSSLASLVLIHRLDGSDENADQLIVFVQEVVHLGQFGVSSFCDDFEIDMSFAELLNHQGKLMAIVAPGGRCASLV
jgi:hypothetical protein